MKITIQNILLGFCAVSLLTLNSCKEESGCTDPLSINYDAQAKEDDGSCQRANLTINITPTVDGVDITPRTTYKINETNIRFDLISFYLTDLKLTKDPNSLVADDSTSVLSFEPILARAFSDSTGFQGENTGTTVETSLELESTTPGRLTNIQFNIGVDTTLNHADPALLPAENPLSADSPHIQHWNWAAGYIFMKIEGTVDVNGDDAFDAADDGVLFIHCGFDSNLAPVSLAIDQSIDQIDNELNLNLDMAQVFDGYDLTTQLLSLPNMNPEYATQVMSNVGAAISAE